MYKRPSALCIGVVIAAIVVPTHLAAPAASASAQPMPAVATAPAGSHALVLAQAGSTGGTIGNQSRAVSGEEPRQRRTSAKRQKSRIVRNAVSPSAASRPAAVPLEPYRCRVDLGYGRYEECK